MPDAACRRAMVFPCLLAWSPGQFERPAPGPTVDSTSGEHCFPSMVKSIPIGNTKSTTHAAAAPMRMATRQSVDVDKWKQAVNAVPPIRLRVNRSAWITSGGCAACKHMG